MVFLGGGKNGLLSANAHSRHQACPCQNDREPNDTTPDERLTQRENTPQDAKDWRQKRDGHGSGRTDVFDQPEDLKPVLGQLIGICAAISSPAHCT
jgi:hypothetical protein